MGLSVAIAGGIVMFVMVYVMLVIPNMVDQTISISRASSDISEIESSALRTSILVSSLTVTDAENGYVQLAIENTGTEKIWDFEKFDLIITYQIDSAPWNNTESMTYSGGCSPDPASKNWCKQSITDDIIDPNILNNGETLVARAKVSQAIDSGLVISTVSTSNGIVADRTYTAP